MKKKIKNKSIDQDQPIGNLQRIADFLPAPDQLIPQEDKVKITLVLDKGTVLFFKENADKSKVKYQRMMREVLKGYANKYAT